MGDRIVVMDKAVVQQVADPLTIYDHPANRFVASFVGSPPMNFLNGKIVRSGQGLFFNEGQFRLRIVEDVAASLGAYENKPVVFGIRPEDLYDKLFITDAPTDCIVTSTVDLVEPLGAEVYLYLRSGHHTIIARVGPHDRPEVNQDIECVFDMGKAHFFHPETGAAIV